MNYEQTWSLFFALINYNPTISFFLSLIIIVNELFYITPLSILSDWYDDFVSSSPNEFNFLR